MFYCLFQDTVTLSGRAVDQLESRGLETLQDTEPIAEHFLIGSAHLKPCPLQVHRGNQMMDALQSPQLDPVLENSPLSTVQVSIQEVNLRRKKREEKIQNCPVGLNNIYKQKAQWGLHLFLISLKIKLIDIPSLNYDASVVVIEGNVLYIFSTIRATFCICKNTNKTY